MRKVAKNKTVYLCFPPEEELLAGKFKKAIEKDGIHCLVPWEDEVVDEMRIDICACFVVLYTLFAYTDEQVEHDITYAYGKGKKIFPCYFSEEKIPEPVCNMLDPYMHQYVGCLHEHEIIARTVDEVHQEIFGY